MSDLILLASLWHGLLLAGAQRLDAIDWAAERLGDKATVAAVHQWTSEWRFVLGNLTIVYYDPDTSRRVEKLFKDHQLLEKLEEAWNETWGAERVVRRKGCWK